MRRLLYILLLFLTLPVVAQEEKLRQHGFSVSDDRKVFFAPGNLQYNAAMGQHLCADGTMQPGTWRFAEHQWDYIGKNNENIAASYNGWIDLFGWGTSGWNSGAVFYQPWDSSDKHGVYIETPPHDMTDDYRYKDWAVFNAIGNDAPQTWRTLTKKEWIYLLYSRPNAKQLYGIASIGGTLGLVLLPDDYTSSAFLPEFIPEKDLNNGKNVYTVEQWLLLENEGAIFLPCSGRRLGTEYKYEESCFYWSATQELQANGGASCLFFTIYNTNIGGSHLYYGNPVRPVWNIPKDYLPDQQLDTIVCDTLLPITWRGHKWEASGVIIDTLQSVCGTDSISRTLNLQTEKCCRDLITIVSDTTVCDTLLPFTWRGMEFAETGEKRIIEKNSRECDSIEYIYALSTYTCEKLWPIIVNKYNWQLLCDNVALRKFFPERMATAFQWYKNEQPISGATDDDYAEQNELCGVFQLNVKLDDGRSIWSNIIEIKAKDEIPIRVQIYNSQGMPVSEEQLSQGVYLFRYERGDEVWIEKKWIP